MQVWFVFRVDRDGDEDMMAVCMSEESANSEVLRQKKEDEDFYLKYGIRSNHYYDVYSMDVIE